MKVAARRAVDDIVAPRRAGIGRTGADAEAGASEPAMKERRLRTISASTRAVSSICRATQRRPDRDVRAPALLRKTTQITNNAGSRFHIFHPEQFHPGAGEQSLWRGDERVDDCFVPDDARLPQIFGILNPPPKPPFGRRRHRGSTSARTCRALLPCRRCGKACRLFQSFRLPPDSAPEMHRDGKEQRHKTTAEEPVFRAGRIRTHHSNPFIRR